MKHYDWTRTICGCRERCDYKIFPVFVIYKMIKQYTICEDIIDILKLLCCTHSISLDCWKIKEHLLNLSIVKSCYMEVLIARPHWPFHDEMSQSFFQNELVYDFYIRHKVFSLQAYNDFKIDCNLRLQRICENPWKLHNC